MVVAKLRDEAKVRQVMSYVVLRAIDSDHTPVVGPAIEALQEMAIAAQDAGLLLQAADESGLWWWTDVIQAGGIFTSSYVVLVLAHALEACSGRIESQDSQGPVNGRV